MAYFSNGSEGMALDDQCAECIHADHDVMCPIAGIQLEFNYDQLNKGNEDLKKAMTILIDDSGICNMKQIIDAHMKAGGKVNLNQKCFQRPLKFGDEEQIEALQVD